MSKDKLTLGQIFGIIIVILAIIGACIPKSEIQKEKERKNYTLYECTRYVQEQYERAGLQKQSNSTAEKICKETLGW